ncbi:hypothetical protein X777_09817 [Ooceraea biroi]|uniref:Integrase zinc-binding domain-containing protein n=1 Tax=Ooceraea biroi TaxID=2015173 RepID=A0A026W626_OOCBI|nr:hypothetical protein X777_09817 [Ooceraea biroi]
MVKKKINALRTSYRKELDKIKKSMRSGAGTEEVYIPTLWYFKDIDFLRDQETPIAGISTLDLTEDDDNEKDEINAQSGILPPAQPEELEESLMHWIKYTQTRSFSKDIEHLKQKRPLDRSSHLHKLTPFLDSAGLLRLGGRLRFAPLHPDQRNPFILPRELPLTTLLIRHHHLATLHGETQLTLASLRQRFWILGGRVPIRMFIHRCLTCVRHQASTLQQRMGQLTLSRVTPARAFLNTGVDYAGPFTLKTFRGRGAKRYKGFLILFICLLGLGFTIVVTCRECDNVFINSCPLINNSYEVNRRIVLAMRLLGIGLNGIIKFCAFMDLPRPVFQTCYDRIIQNIFVVTETVRAKCIKKVAEEEKKLSIEKGQTNGITVSDDGSWRERGFSSLYGLVTLIGWYTGKVVDVLVKSKYCKVCEYWKKKEDTAEYQEWAKSHSEQCQANHEGSAEKMEMDAVVEMFLRSETLHNVKYSHYIGDGDSKTFKGGFSCNESKNFFCLNQL